MVFFRRPLFLAGSAVALFDVSLPPVGWVEEITDTDEKVRLSSSSKFQSVVDVLEMFEDWSEPYVAAFDEGDRVAAPTAGNVSERLGALLDRGQSAVFRVEKLDSEGQETLYEGLHGLRGQRYYSTHLYFSSPGSAALKNHSDVTDVAVWQLAGSKSWLLCDADRVETASIARRLDTCATYDDDDMATIDAETSGDCRTVLLEAGDALWVPRRTVHSARATDESLASLHVTVAIENVRRRRRAQMTTPVTFVDGCEDAGLVENCFCEVQGGGETGGDTQCSRDEVGPERCPPGTFSPTGFYAAETESSCNDGCDADCDAGCDNVGSSCDRSCDDSCDTNCDECATCRACPAGRFSSEFGSTTCTECPGGDLEACSNECVTASPTIVDNDQPNAPPSLGPGQSSKKKKSSGDDTGAAGLIIGIVVLVLILLLCAAALGYYFHKRAHGVQYASATEIENDPIPGFNIVELPSFGSKK